MNKLLKLPAGCTALMDRKGLTITSDGAHGAALYSVTVQTLDYIMWRDGLPLEKAMPYLDASQRDFLQTGEPPSSKWFNW